jgi:hypothetical protein
MVEQQQLYRFQMMKMHVKLWSFYRRFYKKTYDDLDALAAALKSSSILQDF